MKKLQSKIDLGEEVYACVCIYITNIEGEF